MATATIESGVYFIQNYGTGAVIDLVKGSSADGTKTQGHSKRELWEEWVPAQLWIINQLGSDNIYTIQSAVGGTFLTLNESGNGKPIECFKGKDTNNQKWEISRSNKGTCYVIRNKATGTYIDLLGGHKQDGAGIVGWSGSGVGTRDDAELWHIIGAS